MATEPRTLIKICPKHGDQIFKRDYVRRGPKYNYKCPECEKELQTKIKIKKEERSKLKRYGEKIWICCDCGCSFLYKELTTVGFCKKCEESRLKMSRTEARRRVEEKKSEYKFAMRSCGTKICDTLHAHRDMLSEDPERLSTSFLIGLICGEEEMVNWMKSRSDKT
jgi:hypothetical protein